MSNILIIKHGSLGDIAQASGAIQDISENHKDDQIHLLTTKPYFELFKKNPFIHNVILDKRLSRFNLIYLYFLMRTLKKMNIKKFMTFKIYLGQNFIKIFYLIRQALIYGQALKRPYLRTFQKKNLIKIQCLIDLNIN